MYQDELNREQGLFRESLFIQWTDGLTPLEQRMSIFTHIRDIPYAIVSSWRDAEDPVMLMIMENRGWCGPKHHLLSWMFRRMGIEIRFVIIPFRWQDQQIRYPDPLREILPSLPDTSHLCCKAFLRNNWRLLDATWDAPLRSAGFPVNEPWDGISETLPAVISIQSAETGQKTITSPGTRMQQAGFIDKLNQWMEDIRSGKKG